MRVLGRFEFGPNPWPEIWKSLALLKAWDYVSLGCPGCSGAMLPESGRLLNQSEHRPIVPS